MAKELRLLLKIRNNRLIAAPEAKPEAKRLGRPPKPPSEKRRNRVVIYLTDAEVGQIDAWCRELPSETRSAFAREATLQILGQWGQVPVRP